MIGDSEMTWTAICEKDGRTSAISFNSFPDATDALKNIKAVVQCDGYRVLALVKGNLTGAFYGIDSETDTVISDV